MRLMIQQQDALEKHSASLQALVDGLGIEIKELRLRIAGGGRDDFDLDATIELDDDSAEQCVETLRLPEAEKFISTIKDPMNRLIFKGIIQITLSKSAHARSGLRFDPLSLHLANAIRMQGNAAYKALRGLGLPLPSPELLDEITRPLQSYTGTVRERLYFFKASLKAAGIATDTPLVVSIDGVSLRAGLYYSASQRTVAGYSWDFNSELEQVQQPADAGPAGDEGGIPHPPAPPTGAGVAGRSDKAAEPYGSIFTGKLAKHAEVVLIRDLCGKIKMSVGFYPLDSERGHAMADLALEVIAELTYAGLNPACLAWDGGAPNRAAWRHLCGALPGDNLPFGDVPGALPSASAPGVDADAADIASYVKCWFPNPVRPSRRIYIVFDPEHVLKRHRNALELLQGDRSASWVFPTGTVDMSWDHIRTAYQMDQFENRAGQQTFLTRDAVNVTGAGFLSVGLASVVVHYRCISYLRLTGQRVDIFDHRSASGSGPMKDGSAPSSPLPSGAADGGGMAAPDLFGGNPHRATCAFLQTCRIIFDGTYQPVFLRSATNSTLREAWGAALLLADQAWHCKQAGERFIAHESISDPLVTCASFLGILRDYIEPRVRDIAGCPGMYGRAPGSHDNERYYGELRGTRFAAFGTASLTVGEVSRRDAQLSIHTADGGARNAFTHCRRRSNVLSDEDTGSGAIRPISDSCTAGGTALSLVDTQQILRPEWSGERERLAAERALVIHPKYEFTQTANDSTAPRVSLSICSYRQGTSNAEVRHCVQQEAVAASLTGTQHARLHVRSVLSGYSALPHVRVGPDKRLGNTPAYRDCARRMLTRVAADVPHRKTPECMLPGSGGALVSIDDLPEAYATAHVEVVARFERHGVEAWRLHRPSLLLLRIFERMIEVLKPLLKVTAVQHGGASYVQDLVVAVAADERLRELYHTALAPAGCGPIPAVARSGSGSEDAVYELLARFVEPFVLAAWKQFRNGVLDQALLHAGTTTKAPTMARLEAAHASAAERLDTARRKLVAGKAAGGRGGASLSAAIVIEDEDDSDIPVPEGAGQKRKRPASADPSHS